MNYRTLVICVGLPLLILIALLGWILAPGPAIRLSPSTTYISQPLRVDGLPDYERRFLNEGLRITAQEDNAAVLMWQALWPGDASEAEADLVLRTLGCEEIPDPELAFSPVHEPETEQRIADWLADQNPGESNNFAAQEHDAVERVVKAAMSRPWTRKQIPPLADWVEQNADAFDLIVSASKRPKLFSPSPTWLNGEYDTLISSLLPLGGSIRSATRGLCIRAMLRVGEGRIDEAFQDARACLRLASLTRQGICFVEEMVAIAAYSSGFRALATILHNGDFSPKKLISLREELAASTPFYDSARILDQGERLTYLDSLIAVRSRDRDPLQGVGVLLTRKADWNVALRNGNRMFDRLVAAASMPARSQRMAAVAKIYSELDMIAARGDNRHGDWRILFDSKHGGEVLSDIFLSLMVPAVESVFNAEDRQATCREMALIAVELAIYRAEHDHYPENLEELSVTATIDLYSGKPFIYQRSSGNGYLLYSVFENGVDDGGNDLSGTIFGGEWSNGALDEGKTDLVIRLPTPSIDIWHDTATD